MRDPTIGGNSKKTFAYCYCTNFAQNGTNLASARNTGIAT